MNCLSKYEVLDCYQVFIIIACKEIKCCLEHLPFILNVMQAYNKLEC